MIRKICAILLALILSLESVLPVLADEISVSGNGESSANSVNVSTSSTQAVEQTNTASVDNNVSVDANTGENNASDNTGGDASINTGSIEANVGIDNSLINVSSVDIECCPNDLEVKVAGNGSDSQNTVGINQNGSTTITINNNATVNNSVNGSANTGNNNANNNTGGDVSITTGNIKASDNIDNSEINVYRVGASVGGGSNISASIIGNGTGSNNSIALNTNNSSSVNINNNADIDNNSKWDLNTGNNNANGNSGGSVSIVTGDIEYISTIKNGPINVGIVDIDCCPTDDNGGPNPPPPDGFPPPPPGPGNGAPCPPNCPPGGKDGDGGGGAAAALAVSIGEILPITGGNFTLLLLFLAHGLMLFLGWYLRIHSGRAPNLNFYSLRFI